MHVAKQKYFNIILNLRNYIITIFYLYNVTRVFFIINVYFFILILKNRLCIFSIMLDFIRSKQDPDRSLMLMRGSTTLAL